MREKELTDDLVQPFQLCSSSLRGRLVRLGPALNLILHQHAYPGPVGALVGEAMTIAAALGTALKYEGVFTFQVKGDGDVRMLVADVMSDGGIRAYAQFTQGMSSSSGRTAAQLLGKGHLALTCTLTRPLQGIAESPAEKQHQNDRYQGIVSLEGESLAEAVQHYFRQSEQIPTGIVVAVHQDEQQRWRGGCLMLQRVPREGGMIVERDTSTEDDWLRAMMLMGTCTPAELTDFALEPNQLLYRLFHEEGVRVFDPHAFRHQCRCSEERVTNMLRSLPRTEVEDMAVDGVVSVTCEFCNRSYRFNQMQRQELYAK